MFTYEKQTKQNAKEIARRQQLIFQHQQRIEELASIVTRIVL
jgi:hypothetical protein